MGLNIPPRTPPIALSDPFKEEVLQISLDPELRGELTALAKRRGKSLIDLLVDFIAIGRYAMINDEAGAKIRVKKPDGSVVRLKLP